MEFYFRGRDLSDGWWRVGTALRTAPKQGPAGEREGGEGNGRPITFLEDYVYLQLVLYQDFHSCPVVSQLFRKSSGAPVDRSPRPRCAGMKSRPREFRRPSDANTSIVFTFSLWVWTCVAAFFCSLLPARRSSETAFDPLPQYLAQSRYSVNVCSRKE